MRKGVAVTATFTIRKALCSKAIRHLLFPSCSCQNGVQFCSDKTTCSDKTAFRLSRCNELQKDRKRLWRHKLLLQLQTSVLLSHFVLDHFDIPYQGHQQRTALERVRLKDSRKLRASLSGTFLRLWWKDVVNHCLVMMMMKWCLMSSDVSWHIREKLWPMPKHCSINLYVHGNPKAR